jgi:hypothetical protein
MVPDPVLNPTSSDPRLDRSRDGGLFARALIALVVTL